MQKYEKYFEFDFTLFEILLCLEKFYLGEKMMIRVAVASDVKELGKVDVALLANVRVYTSCPKYRLLTCCRETEKI